MNLDQAAISNKENLSKVFNMLDKDGNGTVEKKELVEIFADKTNAGNKSSPTTEIKEVEDIFKEYDSNGDGLIDFNEFIQAMSKI